MNRWIGTDRTSQTESGQSATIYLDTLVDKDSMPLYRSIYLDLVRDISSGKYPIGSLLPTENELCRHYGASRNTIRAASKMLSESGLVSRRARIGTRVESDRAGSLFTQRMVHLPDLFQYMKNATLKLERAQQIAVDGALAAELRCPPGKPWLHVEAVKHLNGSSEPASFVDAYIRPEYTDITSDIGKVRLPLSRLIQERYGVRVSEVVQEFSAAPILGRMAQLLRVSDNSAGLLISRKYYSDDGVLMLATKAIFPHDRMKYSMSLRLSWT